MADTEQKTVLLDVELSGEIDKSIQRIIDIKKKIQELTKQQAEYTKQLQDCTLSEQEYNKKMVVNENSIKALKKVLLDQNNTLTEQYKQTDLVTGSMNQLSGKLSALKRAYRNLSEEERNSDFGTQIKTQAKELNDRLKELEAEYGQFGRNVGNYNEAAQIVAGSLKTELKNLTDQLTNLALAGKQGTEEYEQLVEKAAQIRDAIADTREDINNRASDSANIDALSDAMQLLTSSTMLLTGALGLSNSESEEFNKIVQKMTLLIGMLNALENINKVAQQQSILVTKTRTLITSLFSKTQATATATTTASTLATKKLTLATIAQNVATKTVTIATTLWNAVLKANPIVAIIAVVMALITAIVKLTSIFSSSAKAMKEMSAIEEEWTQKTEKGAERIEQAEKKKTQAINKTDIQARKRILQLRKNGATEEQIAEATYQNEIKKLDVTIQTTEELLKQYSLQRNEMVRLANAHKLAMEKLDKDSDKYKEAQQKLKEYNDQIKELNKNIEDGTNLIESSKLSKEEKKLEQEQKKRQKANSSNGESATEKRYKKEKKAMENLQKLQEKNNELEATLLDDSLTSQINHEDKVFNQKQENKRKQIELDRKYNKITEQEAQTQYTLLEKDEQIYNNNRQKKLDEYLQNQLASIEKSDEEQLQQLKNSNQQKLQEYEQALYTQAGISQTLLADTDGAVAISPQEEKIQRQVQELRLALYKQEQEQEERIKEESLQKRIEMETQKINQQYEGDLLKYSENEKKKTEIEIERLQKIIDYKKNTENQDTTQEEAQLLELQAKQRKLQLDSDLLLTLNTQKEKFEAQKNYYLQEIELASDNQEKRKQLENELFELEKQHNQSRIEQFNNYALQVSNIANGLSGLMSAKEEAQTQKYEQENEKQKEVLQQRLDAGLLSQEQYDKQVANLDATLDKKKQQIAIKQAKREKALKIFETVINTASAIMKLWTELDPISAGIMSAVVGSTGALQLATIKAEPLPKASKGGLIKGKRHSQGGTIIEAEDGEMIINRKSTAKYGALLEAINQNNIKPLGLSSPNTDFADLQQAIKDMKVFVSVEDINRGQKNYAKIESKGN
ncbi:MAG: hypothetical protein Q4Q06_06700, partial [Bacteroidota bacterium]|nr:hypothetical protein [Bacteroidota bacterium]